MTERSSPCPAAGIAAQISWGNPPPTGWVTPFPADGVRYNMRAMRPTVLMVDDHDGFRTRARVMLEADGFDVVAEAATGEEAVALAADARPDVALVDLQLPDVDGFTVADRIRAAGTAQRIVLISGRELSDYGDRFESSTADSFIPKSELSGDRLRAVIE